MKKPESTLLKFAIIGTLIVFAMAAVSYLFFREPEAPSTDLPEVQESASQPVVAGDATAFVIDAEQSEVRFTLGELLGGEPTTVIGDSDNLSGTIYFSADAPQDAEISEIVINARDLETDNSFRNRAIQNQILETSSYEYIRFMPTSISGLPGSVAVSATANLEITGNLTIKETTREVTFSGQVTVVSETQLDGHAETMVAYADYGIFIPNAPRVADVDEEVLLEIDFVALAE